MVKARRPVIFAVVVLSLAGAGAYAKRLIRQAAEHKSAAVIDGLIQESDAFPEVSALKPLPSGPGVLVLEPVGGAHPGYASFGAGCARWLQLVVGGQPEFGKTPLWASVDVARKSLGAADLRLSLEDAIKLGDKLGITHVAVGTLAGDAKNGTLSYQLWEIIGRKPVGTPVVSRGTNQAIADSLPAVAGALCKHLGLRKPAVPVRVGDAAFELGIVGALPWCPGEEIPAERMQTLGGQSGLVPQNYPLATNAHVPLLTGFAFLVNRGALQDGPQLMRWGAGLVKLLPGNALVLAELGYQAPEAQNLDAKALPLAEVRRLLKRTPNSYLLHTAAGFYLKAQGAPDVGRTDAEMAVRCAPQNPSAWISLAGMIDEQADLIRQARFISDMTDAESAQVQQFYEAALPLLIHAVRLDPSSQRGWLILAQMTAFAGEEELALAAYERAYRIDSSDRGTLSWGIQLYQPKWYGDENRLKRVAERMAQASAGWPWAQRLEEALAIHHAGLEPVAEKLVHTPREREEFKRYLEIHERSHQHASE
jgi:tetratricopeptide (TPR) repeat protein